jgi:hypothetical protein
VLDLLLQIHTQKIVWVMLRRVFCNSFKIPLLILV